MSDGAKRDFHKRLTTTQMRTTRIVLYSLQNIVTWNEFEQLASTNLHGSDECAISDLITSSTSEGPLSKEERIQKEFGQLKHPERHPDIFDAKMLNAKLSEGTGIDFSTIDFATISAVQPGDNYSVSRREWHYPLSRLLQELSTTKCGDKNLGNDVRENAFGAVAVVQRKYEEYSGFYFINGAAMEQGIGRQMRASMTPDDARCGKIVVCG